MSDHSGTAVISSIRLLSLLDGLSFIILLYFAIYEKRILGDETAIRLPGMVHGLIFSLLAIALFLSYVLDRIGAKTAALTIVCAFIPFAPFWWDKHLKSVQKQQS